MTDTDKSYIPFDDRPKLQYFIVSGPEAELNRLRAVLDAAGISHEPSSCGVFGWFYDRDVYEAAMDRAAAEAPEGFEYVRRQV
jgi:hypothetical protein